MKVAAVATFIRGSFDNAYPSITDDEVKRVRAESVKSRRFETARVGRIPSASPRGKWPVE
ncbi:MAG: hypothetical protein ABIX28_23090 [Vicinamibacterales bacterium]